MGKLLATAPAVALIVAVFSACSSLSFGQNAIRDDVSLDQQLFTAAGRGNAKLVKALLARGANPNAVVKITPLPDGKSWNDTPYIAAACAGGFNAEVFDLIVQGGGDMNTRRSKTDELPPPFQGCGDTFSSQGDASSSPGILLSQMLKNGFVLPPAKKISHYLVRYPEFLDGMVPKAVIPLLPPDVAAAVIEDGKAKMAEKKRAQAERWANESAERKRRSDEEYANASPEFRKILDLQRQIVQAQNQGLPSPYIEATSPPKSVGDMACRKGQLQYQTCTNPSFPQSCVNITVPGIIYGWAEAFSPDQSRAQFRAGGVEFSGRIRYPVHSQVTFAGLGAGKGDTFWDAPTNWYICHDAAAR